MHIESYSRTKGEPSLGTWQLRRQQGELAATWSRPKCGASTNLGPGSGYSIDFDGKVSPLFVCVTVVCDYQGLVRLAGWVDRELFVAMEVDGM